MRKLTILIPILLVIPIALFFTGCSRDDDHDGGTITGVYYATSDSWRAFTTISIASEIELIEQIYGTGMSQNMDMLNSILDDVRDVFPDFQMGSFSNPAQFWAQYELALYNHATFRTAFTANRFIIIHNNRAHFAPAFMP